MLNGHVFRDGETIVQLDGIQRLWACDTGAVIGVGDGLTGPGEHIVLVAAGVDFALLQHGGGAMAPAQNTRNRIQRDTALVGVLFGFFGRGQKHYSGTVGDLTAIVTAHPAFNHRVFLIVG